MSQAGFKPRFASRLACCRYAAMNILKTVIVLVAVAVSAPLPAFPAGKWDGMYRETKAMFDGKKTAGPLYASTGSLTFLSRRTQSLRTVTPSC